MGMTIDEITDGLEHLISVGAVYDDESLSGALVIIGRYQKIEKIIKDHDADSIPEDYWYIDEIREVINGNDE